MKTSAFKGFAAVLIMFSFCSLSCEKDPDCSNNPPVTDYYLSESDSLKIPYTGFDTLIYWYDADGKRDTITYIGQGKEYFYVDEEYYGSFCVTEINRYHGFKINFESEKKSVAISLIAFHAGAFGDFGFKLKQIEFKDLFFIVERPSYVGYIDYAEFDGRGYSQVARFEREGHKFYYNKTYGLIRTEFSDSSIFQIIP